MYTAEYINCRVCGEDKPKFLGIRGNREYAGAKDQAGGEEHMVTNVVKCANCGFVYANPIIITDQKGYDDPQDYMSSSSTDPKRLFGFTLNLIEKYKPNGKILDIGCAKGEFLLVAKNRGWDVFGLEPSPNFAKYANSQYGINIHQGTLEDAEYPDRFFDVVVLNMVLEHIDDPKSFIRHIRRILNDNGFLFIEVPNTEGLMLKAAAAYFKLRGKDWSPLISPLHYPFHSYGYNISSIRHLLMGEGFDIEKIIIRNSSLRGFRRDSGGTTKEKLCRDIISRLAGSIGKGDVLMAIARKKTND